MRFAGMPNHSYLHLIHSSRRCAPLPKGFYRTASCFAPLDFSSQAGHSGGCGMKARTFTFAVCLLYVMVALFAGNLPHHHDHGTLAPDSHCAACTWHLNSVTDTPLVFTPVLVSEVEVPLPQCNSVAPRTVFILSSASRAPPAVPA
jgi:hypothetical protein